MSDLAVTNILLGALVGSFIGSALGNIGWFVWTRTHSEPCISCGKPVRMSDGWVCVGGCKR